MCVNMARRRLHHDLELIKSSDLKTFQDLQVDENDIFTWQGLLVPDRPPYNKGAFNIEFKFPADYPFKPPRVRFMTKIYHPNINENGNIDFSLICTTSWKASTKMCEVIQGIVDLLEKHDPIHTLRGDLQREYENDKKKFLENAESFTKEHSEARPVD